jgi:hypothetical protein
MILVLGTDTGSSSITKSPLGLSCSVLGAFDYNCNNRC